MDYNVIYKSIHSLDISRVKIHPSHHVAPSDDPNWWKKCLLFQSSHFPEISGQNETHFNVDLHKNPSSSHFKMHQQAIHFLFLLTF